MVELWLRCKAVRGTRRWLVELESGDEVIPVVVLVGGVDRYRVGQDAGCRDERTGRMRVGENRGMLRNGKDREVACRTEFESVTQSDVWERGKGDRDEAGWSRVGCGTRRRTGRLPVRITVRDVGRYVARDGRDAGWAGHGKVEIGTREDAVRGKVSRISVTISDRYA